MPKYHISADGQPRTCVADTGGCRLNGGELEHYDSLEAAYDGLEKTYGDQALASVSRDTEGPAYEVPWDDTGVPGLSKLRTEDPAKALAKRAALGDSFGLEDVKAIDDLVKEAEQKTIDKPSNSSEYSTLRRYEELQATINRSALSGAEESYAHFEGHVVSQGENASELTRTYRDEAASRRDAIVKELGGMTLAEAASEEEKSRVFNRDALANAELININNLYARGTSADQPAKERKTALLQMASHYDSFGDFKALSSYAENEAEKNARMEAVTNSVQSAYELRMKALPEENFFNRRRVAREKEKLNRERNARLKELSSRLS